jgi:hypothetical protein
MQWGCEHCVSSGTCKPWHTAHDKVEVGRAPMPPVRHMVRRVAVVGKDSARRRLFARRRLLCIRLRIGMAIGRGIGWNIRLRIALSVGRSIRHRIALSIGRSIQLAELTSPLADGARTEEQAREAAREEAVAAQVDSGPKQHLCGAHAVQRPVSGEERGLNAVEKTVQWRCACTV